MVWRENEQKYSFAFKIYTVNPHKRNPLAATDRK